MVRLKVLTTNLPTRCVLHFNSTMVRLKGSRVVPDLAVYAFQFHDGSIKGHIAPIKAVFL